MALTRGGPKDTLESGEMAGPGGPRGGGTATGFMGGWNSGFAPKKYYGLQRRKKAGRCPFVVNS